MSRPTAFERVAREAHANQFRRGGAPYIDHPARVADMVATERQKHLAWVHDVIEDCEDAGVFLLDRYGIPDGWPSVWSDLQLLTKRHGQDYEEYIRGIRQSPDATVVKIADIMDNLMDSPTPQQVVKYFRALQILSGVETHEVQAV